MPLRWIMLGVLFVVRLAIASTPSALYGGRLATGVGGTIFNGILTKMVTEWFFGKEFVTALAVMLTAWPIGIALGLLSQGPITELYGWTSVMYATAGLALIALLLTALLCRRPQALAAKVSAPLRFGLPKRQFIHISVVGIAWTLFNASLILVFSFAPDALAVNGYGSAAARSSTSLCMWVTLISIPLGGRVMERLGHVTPAIVVTLLISTGAALAIAQGLAPELLFVALGIFFGIPAGALMALSAEAVSTGNRGAGLGIFYLVLCWHDDHANVSRLDPRCQRQCRSAHRDGGGNDAYCDHIRRDLSPVAKDVADRNAGENYGV